MSYLNRRRFLELSVGTVALATLGGTSVFANPMLSTSIDLNGKGSGRTFNFVGGLSGGGGSSRLLFDYPAAQQSEVLDYLFKPNYGASLQILKVEIGGDTDSTQGSEASHMRSRTDQDYNRGYEWWLMEQAKARNPNIKLYGLEWGAPGWFDGGFWSQDNITYIINWIKNAQSVHGLHIDYIGGWNERGYNVTWYENLASALKSNNLTTEIVAADTSWSVATDLANNSAFNSAVSVVGSHYPCGWLKPSTSCPSSSTAISLNKPLWASENGSQGYNAGAAPLARSLNRDYIDGSITASINWTCVAAWYKNLPYYGDGLMLADQPWSGYYSVGTSLWVTAHTTQFVQSGWQYITSACGYFGGNRNNGSYVTLKSNSSSDYSVIIETMDATSTQTATFSISGGLSTGTVYVWATNVNSSSSSDYFIRQKTITPSNGTYSLTLQPGYVYSLTTTTGQGKGTATSPARAGLSLPYSENFESYSTGTLTRYFSDINAAFESATAGGGRSGKVLRQVITTAPIAWMPVPLPPTTVMGDPDWKNYQVSADVLLEQAGYVELLGNISNVSAYSSSAGGVAAYHLRINNTGAWSLYKQNTSNDTTTLASGSVSYGLNKWITLSLIMVSSTIKALIGGTQVASVQDSTYTAGLMGFQVSQWVNAQFDNVSVVNPSASSSTYSKIVNRNSGLVLDISGGSTSNNGLVVQNTWTGATSQQWQLVANSDGSYKLVNRNSGKVLDSPGNSATQGTQLDQYTDTNSANQWWKLVSTGSGSSYSYIVNDKNGLYADVNGRSTAAGAEVIQYASDGGTNQQWSIVGVS